MMGHIHALNAFSTSLRVSLHAVLQVGGWQGLVTGRTTATFAKSFGEDLRKRTGIPRCFDNYFKSPIPGLSKGIGYSNLGNTHHLHYRTKWWSLATNKRASPIRNTSPSPPSAPSHPKPNLHLISNSFNPDLSTSIPVSLPHLIRPLCANTSGREFQANFLPRIWILAFVPAESQGRDEMSCGLAALLDATRGLICSVQLGGRE